MRSHPAYGTRWLSRSRVQPSFGLQESPGIEPTVRICSCLRELSDCGDQRNCASRLQYERIHRVQVPRFCRDALSEAQSTPPRGVGSSRLLVVCCTNSMASLQEYRCEVCGTVTHSPSHWYVIQCSAENLTVFRWNGDTANAAGARHCCGEAHAQVYISRWFDSICSPPKPDFVRPTSS
jgi:hypothetical protein